MSIKLCINCGHPPCESCGNWCDRLAHKEEDLKNINYKGDFDLNLPDDVKDLTEFEKNKHDEEWYPFLCCGGECKYEK